jgi:hypothetical protein
VTDVIISGIREFDGALSGLSEKMNLAAKEIVTRGSEVIEKNAKDQWRSRPSGSLTTSKRSGRQYYKGYGPYKAERPKPTIRTGNTRNSIGRRYVRSVGPGKWESGTGPTTDYAPYVEFGSRFITTPAFPFMRMGVEASDSEIRAIAERAWRTAQE